MTVAEKFAQKLHNLRSKGEIRDFFIFFDEYRGLKTRTKNGKISTYEAPNRYYEDSAGSFLIVWDERLVSKGKIISDCVNDFDEFISGARSLKIQISGEVFIPARDIYPMVITYAKSLADMIDIPEYLLKVSDVADELDKMVNSFGSSNIEVREGIRYAFSSKNMDEYYPYTKFIMTKSIGNKIRWKLKSSDIPSIMKLQESLSFIGDTFNVVKQDQNKILKKHEVISVVLSPTIFEKVFTKQILSSLKARNVLYGKSQFTVDDFEQKKKVLGTFSMSYDPLLNYKLGTYKFTSWGLKPSRQYFIKFGKLNSCVADNVTFHSLGYQEPTAELLSYANIKFEGIRKRPYEEIRKIEKNYILGVNAGRIKHTNPATTSLTLANPIYKDSQGDFYPVQYGEMRINLLEIISSGKLELVEFIDGQIGCRIYV